MQLLHFGLWRFMSLTVFCLLQPKPLIRISVISINLKCSNILNISYCSLETLNKPRKLYVFVDLNKNEPVQMAIKPHHII